MLLAKISSRITRELIYNMLLTACRFGLIYSPHVNSSLSMPVSPREKYRGETLYGYRKYFCSHIVRFIEFCLVFLFLLYN